MESLVFLRGGALCLVAAAVFEGTALLSAVRLPARPRLGRRGARRREALRARGAFFFGEPVMRFLAGLISTLPLHRWRKHQELELLRAGYCLGLTPDEYSALCVLSAALLSAAITGLAVLVEVTPLVGLFALAFGLVLPKLQIHEIIRGRVKAVNRGLPHAIEIAAMCMGAGLDFPGALRLLSRPAAGTQGVVAHEFSLILEELDLGRTRRQALLNFSERVPSQAVRDFVNAVVQAEQKGNPLAQVIQVQGRLLNHRRSVAAEEAAARAGVLMVLPLVLLVGCILLLLVGPFVVKGVGF